jgi:hypothetical protein
LSVIKWCQQYNEMNSARLIYSFILTIYFEMRISNFYEPLRALKSTYFWSGPVKILWCRISCISEVKIFDPFFTFLARRLKCCDGSPISRIWESQFTWETRVGARNPAQNAYSYSVTVCILRGIPTIVVLVLQNIARILLLHGYYYQANIFRYYKHCYVMWGSVERQTMDYNYSTTIQVSSIHLRITDGFMNVDTDSWTWNCRMHTVTRTIT